MLKGIDPLLYPELLKVLCDMGHGDEIAVVDANFTSARLAGGKPVLRLDGADLARSCRAVLSVFPLDAFVDQPVAYMQVCDTPAGHLTAAQAAVVECLTDCAGSGVEQCEATERFAFYERVRDCFAILQTGELTPYGNFIFKKGVITP